MTAFEELRAKANPGTAVSRIARIKEHNASFGEGVLDGSKGAPPRVRRASFDILDADLGDPGRLR